MAIPSLSVLDLAPVPEGARASVALRRSVDLARLAERLGFVRHWFAEHHGMGSVASSAPELLIGHVAAATRSLRVGAGGIMLPNHAPLKVAELFRTLEALHPGRIDLGLGRAPGSDLAASRALRAFDGEQFPAMLAELLAFGGAGFEAGHPFAKVRAMPDDVPLPPVWILGSSGASARLAGGLGLGYSFASHFSPTPAAPAVAAYREAFRPSAAFPRPHVILGAAVVCADTAGEAERLASSMDLTWLRIRRGQFLPLPSPETAAAYPYTEADRADLRQYRARSVVGTPAEVRQRLAEMAAQSGADELMISSSIFDPEARLRSYELLAQACA